MTRTLATVAALSVIAVGVAVARALMEYQALDDGFDDIIAAEYTRDPATWPRAIRFPQ